MSNEDLNFFTNLIGDLNRGFGEKYNLFACEEAIKIAKSLKTKDNIIAFHKYSSEDQFKMVPDLSDDHSGNTFVLSCKLAISYLPMLREKKIDKIIDAN